MNLNETVNRIKLSLDRIKLFNGLWGDELDYLARNGLDEKINIRIIPIINLFNHPSAPSVIENFTAANIAAGFVANINERYLKKNN